MYHYQLLGIQTSTPWSVVMYSNPLKWGVHYCSLAKTIMTLHLSFVVICAISYRVSHCDLIGFGFEYFSKFWQNICFVFGLFLKCLVGFFYYFGMIKSKPIIF